MLGGPKTYSYAILPLRDIVVFPHMIVPLFVGRPKSVQALEHVMEQNKQILLLTQKSPTEDDPKADDLYQVGVVGNVLQMLKLPDGTVKVLVEGGARMKVKSATDNGTYIEAKCNEMKDGTPVDEETEALGACSNDTF